MKGGWTRSRALFAIVVLVGVAVVLFRLWSRAHAPSAATGPAMASARGPSSALVDSEIEAEFVANASIEGVVLTSDGKAAAKVIVAVQGVGTRRATTTDESGKFSVQSLRGGSFDLSASTTAGEAALVTCVVQAGAAARVELRLTKIADAVTLGGHVRDVLGGPVASGEVWIGGIGAHSIVTIVHTTSNGEFTARVARGKHELRVRAAGYAEAAEHIDLDDDLIVDVVVNPAASIRGTVVASDGKPARKARVSVSADSRSSVGAIETTTDEEGRFELNDLPSESFDIVARTPAEVGRRIGVNVVPTVSRDIQIELQPAASVFGLVRSANGDILAAAEVTLEIDGEQTESGKTGPDGRYRFASVPRGSVVVRACAAKHSCRSSKARTAAAGKRTEIDVELSAGISLRLRVIDPKDEPVASADAYLADFAGCTTGNDGRCTIDHVAARKSKLQVTHVHAGYLEESIEIGAGDTEHVVRLKPGATVRGTVRWDDGAPAADVMVVSDDIVVRSDRHGRYELQNVRPGWLSVWAVGALELGERGRQQRFGRGDDPLVRITPGETKDPVDLVVLRKSKTISGTVSAADGAPVAFASVGLAVDDPSSPWRTDSVGSRYYEAPTTYAGADGRFTIEAVGTGRYVVWARSDEHPTGRAKGVTADSRDVKVVLPAAAAIEGEVRDERGSAVTEFVVFAQRRPLRVTDPQGRFTIRGLPAGEHDVVVETDSPDARSARVVEKVVAAERKKITVVLRRAVTVTGRIVSWPDAKPRAGISLHLSGPTRRTSAPTGIDGRFEVEAVPEGTIELRTWDAEGVDEEWTRQLTVTDARADVGDLSFAPARKYAHPFAYEIDGKRALATGRGNPGGIDVDKGDEVVSVGGVPVATLSNASLAAVCEASAPEVPIVVKKQGASAAVTLHRAPRRRTHADDD